MAKDISKLLSEWPYGAGGNVRRITGDDGREKIQIRVCLDTFHGLLQFECDGRPDGRRPHGQEFYLDYLGEKHRLFLSTGGRSDQYRITHAQCRKLFDESNQVYHRYIVLLQLGLWHRRGLTVADGSRLARRGRAGSRPNCSCPVLPRTTAAPPRAAPVRLATAVAQKSPGRYCADFASRRSARSGSSATAACLMPA